MKHYPKVPKWPEFLAHTREELRYLVEEFSFDEVRADSANFQIDFANLTTRIRAEGGSYGHSFGLAFGPIGDADWWSLGLLLSVRAIELGRYGSVSQLDLISHHARDLRQFASDVLRGDFSCIPALRALSERLHRESLEVQRRDHYERIVARAGKAFASHDYAEFLRLVTPLECMWSKAMKLKVEIARKKLA
jgi:hypothetical protein